MKQFIFGTILISSSFMSSSTFAVEVPTKSVFDGRIRHIRYNPQDVVQVDGVIGVTTHIKVEEGENYVTHAFGDSKAWAFVNEGNHYFMKPKEQNADTNLTIITDRRTYYFHLRYHDKPDAPSMYGIHFSYPDTEMKKRQAVYEKQAVEQALSLPESRNNFNYTMNGDTDIAPRHVWDNHQFTYFEFAGSRDIPGIYMVDGSGLETIVNRNMTGNAHQVVVVHKTNRSWILRLGNRALAVNNEAYDDVGIKNASHTASSSVKRITKGGVHVQAQ